jgi:hypothetical protein
MARLVILRIDDDDEADLFVRSEILRDSYGDEEYEGGPVRVITTIEGMFQVPTIFHGGHQSSGWRKSAKHGWWICRDCGAPSVGWASNIRAVIGEANDLLERPSKNTQERIDMAPDFDNETGDLMEQDDGVNV